MDKNKAARPDGFPIEFYQACWHVIKGDMIELFEDFFLGHMDIKRINYGIITLLPKTKEDNKIQQFRPICLLNCIYKWFTKCLTLRMEPIVSRIIQRSQTTFMKGRDIMNNILALHEILHETKCKGQTRVVLKLDFKKAYDKVHWGFLMKCLRVRGFNSTWCGWIEKILHNGIVAVKVNGHLGPYFQSYKEVRQGDPLSPFLFNVVADCLTHMVMQAQQHSLISGLISHLIPNGVAILQFIDDTIMCLENDMEKARNVKLMLYIFEQMSDLNINFEKSEIILVGGDNNLAIGMLRFLIVKLV
jgi:hypothetical protein